jgi:hypothetical protein
MSRLWSRQVEQGWDKDSSRLDTELSLFGLIFFRFVAQIVQTDFPEVITQ